MHLPRFFVPLVIVGVAVPLLTGVLPSLARAPEPDCADATLPPFTGESEAWPSASALDEDMLLPPRVARLRPSVGHPDLLPPGALQRVWPRPVPPAGPGVVGLAFDALLPPGAAPRRDAAVGTGTGDELLSPSLPPSR